MSSQATVELLQVRQAKASKAFEKSLREMVVSYVKSIKKTNPAFESTPAFEAKLRAEIAERMSSLTN